MSRIVKSCEPSVDLKVFNMQNPHAERHTVLLERIVKNVVRRNPGYRSAGTPDDSIQEKCSESIAELNHCLDVSS